MIFTLLDFYSKEELLSFVRLIHGFLNWSVEFEWSVGLLHRIQIYLLGLSTVRCVKIISFSHNIWVAAPIS